MILLNGVKRITFNSRKYRQAIPTTHTCIMVSAVTYTHTRNKHQQQNSEFRFVSILNHFPLPPLHLLRFIFNLIRANRFRFSNIINEMN